MSGNFQERRDGISEYMLPWLQDTGLKSDILALAALEKIIQVTTPEVEALNQFVRTMDGKSKTLCVMEYVHSSGWSGDYSCNHEHHSPPRAAGNAMRSAARNITAKQGRYLKGKLKERDQVITKLTDTLLIQLRLCGFSATKTTKMAISHIIKKEVQKLIQPGVPRVTRRK